MARAAQLKAMLLAAAGGTLAVRPSAAEDFVRGGYVLPGVLVGGAFAAPNAFVTGVEISAMAYPSERRFLGAGAFVQAMHYGRSSSPSFGRYAGGLQVGGPVGLELGVDRRSSDGAHRATWGAHVAPYVSVGPVTLSVRGTVAMSDSARAHPNEIAVLLGFKLPLPIGDPPPGFDLRGPGLSFGHGRPLSTAQQPRVSGLVASRAWA